MRLLLINPKFPESFWSFNWALRHVLPGKRAVNPPLGLATLAALCPGDWQVDIVDENIESVPLSPDADIVGVCGMGVQTGRQRELLAYYRARGHYVIAGGSYASLRPEEYAESADTVVAGEAEYIWPQFCRDYAAGRPLRLYRETGTVDLADSPVPRFDLLKLDRYANATLQYSRGCPYRCEFCDIIVMFGRKPRVKSIAQVAAELDELRRCGARSVFFVDDNLIGDRRRAKDLLRFLKRYQDEHRYAFSFGTECSLNLAQDEELLDLLQAANFGWVFIGIESADPDSLKETGKTQNLREDPLVSVRRIYAHGIDVLAGFIIGFDNDTLASFGSAFRFITASGIQSAMVGLLTALPGTPLHARMKREGRLRETADAANNTQAMTNIRPKNMGDKEMGEAYRALYRRLLTDAEISRRIRNKIRYLRLPRYSSGYSMRQRTAIFFRVLFKGIVPGGPRRIFHFLRTLPVLKPSRIPLVVADWITGLSMLDFAVRHLAVEPAAANQDARLLASVHAKLVRHFEQERILVTRATAARVPDLAISIGGALSSRRFRRMARELRRLMKRSCASLTLKVEGLPPRQMAEFELLLRRLSRYGDRISVVLNESLFGRVDIDSSVFHLVMPPSQG